MKHIQYAINREDGLVISRVGDEVAWPVLDFKGIGQGGGGFKKGDFNGPMNYNLEKMPVLRIGSDWQKLVWTKYVPTEIKNFHRKFWGMKELPVEQPPRTVEELCQRHRTRFYLVRKDGKIGICHGTWGNNVKLYHWFRNSRRGFVLCGVSDNADDDHKGATKRQVTREVVDGTNTPGDTGWHPK